MADKELERAVLEKFRTALPDFPQGEPTDHEEPDFLIRELGVELIDIIEQATRHAEEIHLEVLRLASQAYEARGLPPLWVLTQWRHGINTDRRRAAEGLAALVATMVPNPVPDDWTSIAEDDWDNLRAYGLEETISGVTVMCSKRKAYNEWTATEGGFVHTEPSDIQRLLDKKETRLTSYRRSCKEVWLLVHFLANRISGSAEITEDIRRAHYRSGFDRAFVFDYFRGDLAELTLHRP
jgi:hypothetical protein